MNKLIYVVILSLGISTYSFTQELAPYIKVGTVNASVEEVSKSVMEALKSEEFFILGSYNPAKKKNLKVIVFSRADLSSRAVKVIDRGALAAPMKIGLIDSEGNTEVSYTNPEYLTRAYLRDNFTSFSSTISDFHKDLKSALSSIGNEFTPFGGTVKADKLKNYHYKIMMPYFTDPVELAEFDSFEQGLNIVRSNLKSAKGNTRLVYELVYDNAKVAVFGVGLFDPEDGEGHFLPKIGEGHVAALPYEIILQDNVLTMLHGKYRIALHWPDLTMGTFMKIMSTPGDIKDSMKGLTE
ncbi:MAG: hypothetical protein HKO90_11185 [Flavobacteriaceae bacterium]|nr:hypothetical protein [Bacteroidia bacterium]NNK88838.1 hypothetical protein [Flavobacteriaceae bacterium]